MSYVLENRKEFERLEKQSQTAGYDFHRELEGFTLERPARVLDAGCGSGVVSRYLAERWPGARVTGCDASSERIQQAREAAQAISNLEWAIADLAALPFPRNHFDGIVCRYVLEHLASGVLMQVAQDLFRCLKPGGSLCAIDIDGYFFNLHPQPPSTQRFLKRLSAHGGVDLHVGRKMPALLAQAGFEAVEWRIETLQFNTQATLEEEIRLIQERFELTLPFMAQLLGSKQEAEQFQAEYVSALRAPGAVLFYNKFIVSAKKPSLKLV